jgi:tetratricopeptide (TPR) repeat protein
LKGRREAYKFNQEGRERAPAYFREAIQLDPNYALAYAGLAEYHLIYFGGAEAFSSAKDAALKALSLDSTLAEGYVALATVSEKHGWDWALAESEFKRAIALSPSSASVHDWYGWYLAQIGRLDEAVAELRLAQQLDPLSVQAHTNLGRALYFARRYDEAIVQFGKALVLDPTTWLARIHLGLVYGKLSRHEDALAELRKAIGPTSPFPDGRTWYVYGLAVAGRGQEARTLLEQLLPSERVPSSLAAVATALGEKDNAFEWLELAFARRWGILASVKVDPVFEGLRSDSRYPALLRRMGLEP